LPKLCGWPEASGRDRSVLLLPPFIFFGWRNVNPLQARHGATIIIFSFHPGSVGRDAG
jgi:hypothetical protein